MRALINVSISPALPFQAAWWTAGALQHAQRKAHDLKHVTLQRLHAEFSRTTQMILIFHD